MTKKRWVFLIIFVVFLTGIILWKTKAVYVEELTWGRGTCWRVKFFGKVKYFMIIKDTKEMYEMYLPF